MAKDLKVGDRVMYRRLDCKGYRDSTIKQLLPGSALVILANNAVARQENLTPIPADLDVTELVVA